MLTFGPRPPAGDVVDLLLECHTRIRSFTTLAARLASTPGLAAAEVAEAAAGVHRYFTQALPLHARDEEESVLPRLRGRDPEVDRELAEMVHEHRGHEEQDSHRHFGFNRNIGDARTGSWVRRPAMDQDTCVFEAMSDGELLALGPRARRTESVDERKETSA